MTSLEGATCYAVEQLLDMFIVTADYKEADWLRLECGHRALIPRRVGGVRG